MMISAKVLKSTLSGHRPLSVTAKCFILRSSNCLTATGGSIGSSSPKAWIHTTTCNQFPGQDWRKMQGKPANPNAYGPLTDGPDYSFLDGRPTPIGGGKLKRAKEQQNITSKIMKLSGEVDFAVTRHATRVKNEKERKEDIIRNKLKPKGNVPPEDKPYRTQR